MREPKKLNNQKINIPVNVAFADWVGVSDVIDAVVKPPLGLGGWAPQAIGWSQILFYFIYFFMNYNLTLGLGIGHIGPVNGVIGY